MNTYYIGGMPVTDELYHHGILGQKWGVRRYQNPDGTLTLAGRKRYGYGISESDPRTSAKNDIDQVRDIRKKIRRSFKTQSYV